MITESSPLSTHKPIDDCLTIAREDFEDWLKDRTVDELLDSWLKIDKHVSQLGKIMKPYVDKEVNSPNEGPTPRIFSKEFSDLIGQFGGLVFRKSPIWRELNKRMHADDGYFGKMRRSLIRQSLLQLRSRYDQLSEQIGILEKGIAEIENRGGNTDDKEAARHLAVGELQEVTEVMAKEYGYKSNKLECWEIPNTSRSSELT